MLHNLADKPRKQRNHADSVHESLKHSFAKVCSRVSSNEIRWLKFRQVLGGVTTAVVHQPRREYQQCMFQKSIDEFVQPKRTALAKTTCQLAPGAIVHCHSPLHIRASRPLTEMRARTVEDEPPFAHTTSPTLSWSDHAAPFTGIRSVRNQR